jgi:hypothetical protein
MQVRHEVVHLSAFQLPAPWNPGLESTGDLRTSMPGLQRFVIGGIFPIQNSG